MILYYLECMAHVCICIYSHSVEYFSCLHHSSRQGRYKLLVWTKILACIILKFHLFILCTLFFLANTFILTRNLKSKNNVKIEHNVLQLWRTTKNTTLYFNFTNIKKKILIFLVINYCRSTCYRVWFKLVTSCPNSGPPCPYRVLLV